MKEYELAVHQKAPGPAHKLKSAETDLISVLQEVSRLEIYLKLSYRNMFSYCTDCLKLSRDNAYTYLKISEKSSQVPELKKALMEGQISITSARRIAPVINQNNKDLWLEKAQTLTQSRLEKELVKVAPRKVLPDRVKPVTEDTSELRCAISSEYDDLIQRAKDILSQKNRRAMGTGETIVEALKFLVSRLDPLEKAKRTLAHEKSHPDALVVSRRKQSGTKGTKKERTAIPAKTRHELMLRHHRQCGYPGCTESKWLDMHHVEEISRGGTHDPGNLILLCWAHHKMVHRGQARLAGF